MRWLKKDLRHGKVVLQITNRDDFWCLSQVILSKDLVLGKATRKIKIGDAAAKKTYTLEIEVEKVELSAESLRVLGKVISEIEDIPKGSYQSITIEESSIITITKDAWPSFQLSRLDDACRDVTKVLLVVVDRGEASFGVLRQFGVEVLGEISGNVIKKAMKEDIREDFFVVVIQELQQYVARLNPDHVVLGSPAFWKDELVMRLKKTNADCAKKVVTATVSVTGKSGLQELVKRDEVAKVLRDDRMVKETALVNAALAEIHKNGLVVYGLQEVKKAAQSGAIKDVLVADVLITEMRDMNTFSELDSLMKIVEAAKGNVHVISSDHDAGKQLVGLGGVVALLRYKV